MTSHASRNISPSNYSTLASKDTGSQSAAFRGARHVFAQASTTKKPLSDTYSGHDGALDAAATAGLGRRKEEITSGGVHLGGPQTSRPSVKRSRTSYASNRRNDAPQSKLSREQSPSHIAAVLAATPKTTPVVPVREPIPITALRPSSRRPSRLDSMEDLGVAESGNEEIAKDTNSLIKLFDSNEKPRPAAPTAHSVRYVRKSTASVEAYRPTRSSTRSFSSSTVSLQPVSMVPVRGRADTASIHDANAGATVAAVRSAKPVRESVPCGGSSIVSARHVPESPAPRRTAQHASLDGPPDSDRQAIPTVGPPKVPLDPMTDPTESFLNKAAVELSSRPARSPTRPGLPTRHTTPGPAHSSTIVSRPPLIPRQTSSKVSLDRIRPGRKPTRTSDSYIPQLTVDSLANAMVASSLASSRAPSPSKPPPLPPPRRHNKHSLFPHHHRQEDSRTPSPAKGLRQTMREPQKSSSEDDAQKHRNHRVRKHHNKHHEGDRECYRNQVTERERKRYEGVWAANRSLFLPADSADMVINIVVRDIWKRSRLPDDVLEEVWDLVDKQGGGKLRREEFVVGMWLIDQGLKGNKLPAKVGESVWGSVRGLRGVNVPVGRR